MNGNDVFGSYVVSHGSFTEKADENQAKTQNSHFSNQIYIYSVPGGMYQTSGGCSLC
jgi:hypothetical protein